MFRVNVLNFSSVLKSSIWVAFRICNWHGSVTIFFPSQLLPAWRELSWVWWQKNAQTS